MMAYIEEHIEEKIERNVLAKFLGCSAYTMQRIFSMMTGFTVSDYIRRRRMSLAVLKLKEGKKVLEVALFCGYSSGEAFSRKFYSIYNIHPKEVKKANIQFAFQPVLEFKTQSYGRTITYRIEESDQKTFYGEYRDIVENIPKEANLFWKEMKEKYPFLMKQLPRYAVVEEKEKETRYWILVKQKQEALNSFSLPKGTWLIFQGKSFVGEEIAALCTKIDETYLKSIPYRRNEKYTLELYYEDYMEVWVLING